MDTPKLEFWLKANGPSGQPTEVIIKNGFTYKNTGIGNNGNYKFEVTQINPTAKTVDELDNLFSGMAMGGKKRRSKKRRTKRRRTNRKRTLRRRR